MSCIFYTSHHQYNISHPSKMNLESKAGIICNKC